MSVVYNVVYVCISVDINNVCTAWQQTSSGGYFTPEVAGLIILLALTLNLIVAGFKSAKKTM